MPTTLSGRYDASTRVFQEQVHEQRGIFSSASSYIYWDIKGSSHMTHPKELCLLLYLNLPDILMLIRDLKT